MRNSPGSPPEGGQTMVDGGAHQGLFAPRAAQRVGPGGKVIAVEAYPANMEFLSRNKALNGLFNIELVPLAAAACEGESSLYVATVVSGGHSLVFQSEMGDDQRAHIVVKTKKLDDILSKLGIEKPDLLKIDVEGAAMAVLDGAVQTLSSRPKIVMEIEGGADAVKAARRRLERAGYKVRLSRSIIYAEPATPR